MTATVVELAGRSAFLLLMRVYAIKASTILHYLLSSSTTTITTTLLLLLLLLPVPATINIT